jgi:hypothetical protein
LISESGMIPTPLSLISIDIMITPVENWTKEIKSNFAVYGFIRCS